MRKLVLIAAMLMASASAHAGSYTIKVEGQRVRVDIPRGCASLSCINLSAPGLADKFKTKEEDTSSTPATTTTPAPAPATTTTAPAPAPAPAAAPAPAPQVTTVAPAPATSEKVTVLPQAPASSGGTILTAPAVSLTPPPGATAQPAPAPAPAPTQVAAAPATTAAPAAPATPSPIGIWNSEKKEGKIRVEECGTNICGYSIEKNGSNGAKVLVNLKPAGDKWTGTIKDPRGGGSYSGHIALRGNDKLRVTGCMFGFCGGETWTRAE